MRFASSCSPLQVIRASWKGDPGEGSGACLIWFEEAAFVYLGVGFNKCP